MENVQGRILNICIFDGDFFFEIRILNVLYEISASGLADSERSDLHM